MDHRKQVSSLCKITLNAIWKSNINDHQRKDLELGNVDEIL